MADLMDVANTLVTTVAGLVYPAGVASASVASVPVMVYVGWPIPAQLDADMLAGKVHISIFPRHHERNTTRYLNTWTEVENVAPGLVVALDGLALTVSGVASSGQQVIVQIGREFYRYAVQASDAPASVAAGLAMAIARDYAGVSSLGAVVTLPAGANVRSARVVAGGRALRELRRQERQFQMAIWAPTPALRDVVAQAIDPVLADMPFLTLPDMTAARLRYHASHMSDHLQRVHVYRRDLIYHVEYATTKTEDFMQVGVVTPLLSVQGDLVGPPFPVLQTDAGEALVIDNGHDLVLE